MSTYLTESDFVTIDIKSVFSEQQPVSGPEEKPTEPGTGETPSPKNPTTKSPKIDWSKELQKRLEANKQLSPESRESDFDIENKFWMEFFTAAFGSDTAALLNTIEQLKKDIKILGFKKLTNPILAFLKIKYVQTELVNTKLINSNTYKALHNVIAKQLVADSELLRSNDYNIIYCRDLYLKQVADIERYLEYQKAVLSPKASVYDKDLLERNKRIFLQLGGRNVKSKTAKLNSLKEIGELLKSSGVAPENKATNSNQTNVNSENDTSTEETKTVFNTDSHLAAFMASPAHAFAAIQYLGMTTQNVKALNALSQDAFSSLTGRDLIKASSDVANEMRKYSFSKDSVEEAVSALIKYAVNKKAEAA